MNQQFLSQTVKKLLWLSDYIVSEQDTASDNYRDNHMKFVFGRVRRITKLLDEAKGLGNTAVLTSELYIDPWLMRQRNVAYVLSTDPFVPNQVREKIANFYFERVSEMATIYLAVMSQFCTDLYDGTIKNIELELKIAAWQRLGNGYFEKGWGWERTEERIIEMRGEIETYLLNLS